MSEGLTQMELYQRIGKAVCSRPEKGAAAAVAEYLQKNYPETAGFSPRNVRRMREFCRTYQSRPSLLAEAMKIGWTQNIVILERCETEEERRWYIQAVQQFGWSKQQLIKEITDLAHTKKSLDNDSEVCYNESENSNYNHAEYTEEAPVQNMDHQFFAQANTAENSAEAIGRTKGNLDEERYIQFVSGNAADKVYHPYSVTSICREKRREKTALHYESVFHCHPPP